MKKKRNKIEESVNQPDPKLQPWEEAVFRAIDAEIALRSHIYGYYSWMTDVDEISEKSLTTLSNLAKEFGIAFVINVLGLAFQHVSEEHVDASPANMETTMIKCICALATNHRETQGVDGCRVGWITKGAESVIDGLEEMAS